ncbi:MAG TPA: hypothetical protein VGD94_19415 [Vicinamibacterales bacterium]
MRWQRLGGAAVIAAAVACAATVTNTSVVQAADSMAAVQQPPPVQQPPAQPPAGQQQPDDEPGGRERTPPPPPPALPATMPAPVTPIVSATPPSPDLRVGLRPGYWDAEQAAWNLRMVSNTPADEQFRGVTNSDLAFTGKYVVQGNYNGFQVFDISNPAKPQMVLSYLCPASQSDVSVYNNLLFVSGEGQTGRIDCGIQGVPEPVSKDRLRGIRIFDISDIKNPKYVANVQTCRGSHTHTVVTDPNDKENVYIYISGSSRVRSAEELPGCKDGPIDDPETARFRLEVIKVPLADPTRAAIVSSPRIFQGLEPPPRRVEPGRGGRGRGGTPPAAGATPPAGANPPATPPVAGATPPGQPPAVAGAGGGRGRGGRARENTGPNQCHDITVYPEIGLAGGACGGYGLLLDITDVPNPQRIDEAADINMSFWHSATFSNDGSKILFSDEWGGGSQPRCRETDKYEWGANALFTIENRKMQFKSYYKMPAAQTSLENCVAHNGSLIPIPGREVMVQGWYQGGISVFDWTDVAKPVEIAYYDRGPVDAERLVSGGSWSVYWYNGLIISSEIARGLDIYELMPSGLISQNEIDAAKTVQFAFLNAQEQRKLVWPPSFAKARAFLDQLERGNGLAAARIAAVRGELSAAEKLSGAPRQKALTTLAAQVQKDASGANDSARVRMLADAVSELAR